jgi:CheY-like chemotaxis protein
VQRVLDRIGFDVVEAENGAVALDRIQQNETRINALILDLTMPVMDGEATLKALQEQGRSIPVLLMSGFSESEAQEKFAGYPVAGFIEKPFDLATLRGKVQSLFGS